MLREAGEFVTEVATAGRAALVDLDTPEDWAAWRAAAAGEELTGLGVPRAAVRGA